MIADQTPSRTARRIRVTGRVQGVGYRPFVYILAQRMGVRGWVLNGAGVVHVHAEAAAQVLDRFEAALISDAPPLARPELSWAERVPYEAVGGFDIRPSKAAGVADIHVPPDLFICPECFGELHDPAARRHRYPFINCTQCGPRYTIIRETPYDRTNTSMAAFVLCHDCQRDYEDPHDRRFHAEPLACPVCGPRIWFTAPGRTAETDERALTAAVKAVEAGSIVAVKGIGGYHLFCDATQDAAVQRLREKKARPDKPLAVMFQSEGADGLGALRRFVYLDKAATACLTDSARPIVLARLRPDASLSPAIAPGLTEVGAFLPYSPLHHLFLEELDRPLVATSGNLSGEPVLTDPAEAEGALATVVDAFLHHDRPIVRPADDSVIRPILGQPCPIRLGRGIAPMEMTLPSPLGKPVLAVGGHQKACIALGWDRRVVISPHIGDLGSPRSRDVFGQVAEDLQRLHKVRAHRLIVDDHTGYASHAWARTQKLPLISVQHHHAHASALAGEHSDVRCWLIFAWDGTGLGEDGTFWGGEAFVGAPGAWDRVASFRTFRLPGGDKAGREPWRSAAALAWEADWPWQLPVSGATLAHQAWRRGLNTFTSSAIGRLFDAAAYFVTGQVSYSFEGQGPMQLEALAEVGRAQPISLPLNRDTVGLLRSDWSSLLPILCDDTQRPQDRATAFHATLARALADQVAAIREVEDFEAVGLTGGVFQNRVLCTLIAEEMARLRVDMRLHRQVPPNDGGLAFGQIIEAAACQDLQIAGNA